MESVHLLRRVRLGPPLVGAVAGAAGLRLALAVVAVFALALAVLVRLAPVAPAT